MLTHADQVTVIAAMPSATICNCFGVTFQVDYRTSSEPVMFGDGSLEQGKPYCIATELDVLTNGIEHGTELTLTGIEYWNGTMTDGIRFVIGKNRRKDGMYNLILSETV